MWRARPLGEAAPPPDVPLEKGSGVTYAEIDKVVDAPPPPPVSCEKKEFAFASPKGDALARGAARSPSEAPRARRAPSTGITPIRA